MPPRDKQDFKERRQQLLDGALQVFATKGFDKATNKEITAAAGIGSPGLIYHYFKDKSDLFRQVLEQNLPVLQLLTHGEELMTKPPCDVLTIFGHVFLREVENPRSVALMKLLLGESFRQPEVAELFNSIGPSRTFAFLSRYLARQMSTGVLKPMDPGAATRCFIGSLLGYIFMREVFPQPDAQRLSPEVMVKTAVEVFLQGMQLPVPEADKRA